MTEEKRKNPIKPCAVCHEYPRFSRTTEGRKLYCPECGRATKRYGWGELGEKKILWYSPELAVYDSVPLIECWNRNQAGYRNKLEVER